MLHLVGCILGCYNYTFTKNYNFGARQNKTQIFVVNKKIA
jgi:hypothetical protein